MPHDSTSAVHVIVVMGVAGAGKTTVGRALADALGWSFIDADDHHSAENVALMRRGIALSDEDRTPWLASLREAIEATRASGGRAVVACSALKHAYRVALVPTNALEAVRFVFLDASEELVRERLAARRGHYAGVALVESQLATLEPPHDAIRLDAGDTPAALVAEIRAALRF
jgi:gluconokinase